MIFHSQVLKTFVKIKYIHTTSIKFSIIEPFFKEPQNYIELNLMIFLAML